MKAGPIASDAALQKVCTVPDVISTRSIRCRLKIYFRTLVILVILYNLESMTLTLKDLKERGHPIDHDILRGLAPCRTNHINRFGDYTLDFNQHLCRPLSSVPKDTVTRSLRLVSG
ncbi:transposase [Marinobacter sp. ELB17]|uniref:transposase n=1 Tax=Marinobacter sp. ELB17 TaxID=270374 RepID=UPI001D0D085A